MSRPSCFCSSSSCEVEVCPVPIKDELARQDDFFKMTEEDIELHVEYSKFLLKNDVPTVARDLVKRAILGGKVLGRGRQGICHYLRGEPGRPAWCIKHFNREGDTYASSWTSLMKEVKNMLTLQDLMTRQGSGMLRRGTVVFVGVRLHPYPVIVTHYAGNNLEDLLNTKRLSGPSGLCIFTEVVAYAKCLMSFGYSHFDLKVNNVAVHLKGKTKPKVTIIDFGLMRKIGDQIFPTINKKFLYAPEL